MFETARLTIWPAVPVNVSLASCSVDVVTVTGEPFCAIVPTMSAGGVETCTWGVPKTLSADPAQSSLRWEPAGAQVVPDAVFYDAEGRLAALHQSPNDRHQ